MRNQPSVKRCVFRRRVNCEVVVDVLTVPDRLFQIVAAATANAQSDVMMDISGFIRLVRVPGPRMHVATLSDRSHCWPVVMN